MTSHWWRDNQRRYRSRETCQRACRYLNDRTFSQLWREPVIALEGDHFEMWATFRAAAWCDDPDAPQLEAGEPTPPSADDGAEGS